MPAGGLVQLITARGEQDLYIIGNPQISFFKTVYRRHTNFSIETVTEVFHNTADFGKTARCNIPKIGDILSGLTLHINIGSLNPEYETLLENSSDILHQEFDNIIGDDGEINENICACTTCIEELYRDELLFGWVNSLGHALIKSVWIDIGGQRIDKHYGEWMEIWTELTQTQEKRAGYYQMIGKVDPTSFTATTFTGNMELYIPLDFWFCKNVGLGLPLLDLYYNQIEIGVDFRDFNECYVKNKNVDNKPIQPSFDASILMDFVYLDIDERKKFYEESHIYLIEQLQTSDERDVSQNVNTIDLLQFNHPVKELIWVVQRNDVIDKPKGLFPNSNYPIGNDWFNYSMFPCRTTARVLDTFDSAVIQFNGHNRFKPMKASYFRLLQPYFKHTRNPINYIYTYSFALKPEEYQPTGHINFSNIDNSKLILKMTDKQTKFNVKYNARVYAVNYNIFVVSNGIGALLFS